MVRLLTSGFEARETVGVSTVDNVDGVDAYSTAVIELTTVRSGSASIKCASGAGNATAQVGMRTSTEALGTTYFARAYLNFAQFPTAGEVGVLRNNVQSCRISVTTAGVVQLWNAVAGTQIGSDGPALSLNTWYLIELSWLHNTGSVDTAEGRVDGVSFASATGLAMSDTAALGIIVGWSTAPGANCTVYIDDVAINDSTGGSQNTWPGAGSVVLLLPVTDNATGTGWNLGTNTAPGGAGHTALANTPPLGVADLAAGSDPKQMRNATSNANVNIDMNMTTYTAAGIATGGTINVIDPITVTAAPVTTSSKQGTVGVASNPAITNIALAAGGTAGAFWSGVAGGTYATGWKISHGTTTYAPSVTLGTAPVMRVTQVTSSTRIAMVCFMGMYVDYTPAAAVQVPYVNPMPALLAQ